MFQKPIGAVSPVGGGRTQAAQGRRQASLQLPAEHQLPRIPVLKHYTQSQRAYIRQTTETAVHRVAAQRQIKPVEAVQVLYANGDHHTRQTLRTYGRVVREQTQIAQGHALTGLANAPVQANPNALTADERLQLGRTGTIRSPQTQEAKQYLARVTTRNALKTALAGAKTTTAQKAAVYRELVSQPVGEAKPGPKPATGINSAVAPLATVKGFVLDPKRNFLVAAAPAVGKLTGPIVKDAISLPRDTVSSAYYAITDPKGAAKAFVQGDPLALAVQGKWNKALTAAAAHPLDTALEIGGVRGIARGAGRLAGVDTVRESAVLPGTPLTEARTYSTSPIQKAIQRHMDQHAIARSEKILTRARAAEQAGELAHADQLFHEAAQADPRLMSQEAVAKRADIHESLAQPARRRGRAELQQKMKPLVAKPQEGGHAQRLIAEGIAPVRTKANGALDIQSIRNDLARYHAGLEKRAVDLKGPDLAANKRLRARVDEARRLPDAQLTELATNSRAIAHITNAQEARNVALGMLDPREALTARLKTYAFLHMGARHGAPEADLQAFREGTGARPTERLLDANGRPLTPEQITQHMQAHGVNPEDVAFFSQRPGALGAGSFNVRALGKDLTRKGFPTRTRTGHAVLNGLIDTHPSKLTANVVRMQQLEAADRNYVRALHDVGARTTGGGLRQFPTKAEAVQFAQRAAYDAQGNRIHGAPEFRAVRINPWGGRESQLRHLVEHGDPEGFVRGAESVSHPISEAIQSAVSHDSQGDGPYAVVPADWANRISAHSDVYRSASPTLRAITGLFKNTVLPLSSSWLASNVSEAALRAAIHDPRILHNILTYRRIVGAVEQVDPEEAGHIRDMLGVGHYGAAETSQLYSSLSQFADSSPVVRKLASALHTLRETPGPKQLADAYSRYVQFVYHSVNSRLETPFREAMAGAHLRQVFGDPGSMGSVSKQAVEDAARGLRNTNSQVRMAEEVRKAYGSYEAHSPRMRRLILQYTPFLPWFASAVRFVGSTLPREHPLVTALIAANNRAAQDWRTAHGLENISASKSFLAGTIPANGGHINLARNTPFSAFQDPLGSIPSLLLPQFSGALHAAAGQNPFGQPLKKGQGRLSAAFLAQLESTVPIFSQIQRATGYQGNAIQKLAQLENPVRTIKTRGAGGSNPFDSAGGGSSSSNSNPFNR